MTVLIDTNIILDILMKRIPFYETSNTVLSYCVSEKLKGYIALHSVSNIYYILRKHFSAEDRRKLLLGMLDLLQIANATHEGVKRALARNERNTSASQKHFIDLTRAALVPIADIRQRQMLQIFPILNPDSVFGEIAFRKNQKRRFFKNSFAADRFGVGVEVIGQNQCGG